MLTDDAWSGPVDDLHGLAMTDETPAIGAATDRCAPSLLHGMIRASSAAIVGCDAREEIVAWSAGAERLFGYRKAEVLGRPWSMLLSDDACESGLDQLGSQVLAGEPSGRVEASGIHRDGSAVPVSIDGRPARRDGQVLGICWTFRDVASRRRVQRIAPIGTFVVDIAGDGHLRDIEASAEVYAMIGLTPEECRTLTTARFLALVAEDDREVVAAEWARAIDSSGEVDIEHRLAPTAGRRDRWVRISVEIHRGAPGQPWRGLGAIRDITAERRREELLAYEAAHDRLTRLPSRALLLRRLGAAMAAGEAAVVASIDLDRFGAVNEIYGTSAGDRLMVAVAERLRMAFATDDAHFAGPARVDGVELPADADSALLTAIPDASAIARTAGDSFIVVSTEPDVVTNPMDAISRVHALFEEPFFVGSEEVWMTACVGTAASGDSDAAASGDGDAELLAARADQALHQAKRRGPVWGLSWESLERGGPPVTPALIGALRRAVHDRAITLAYQPTVDLNTGRMAGVEALARWPHTGGRIDGPMVAGPAAFVPLAEECGLIGALDDLMLDRAIHQVADWQRTVGLPSGFATAVNVSARDLIGDRLLRTVNDLLLATAIDPHSLVLEVTETALMQDVSLAAATIRQIRQLGVGIAIDDFGTGYSSLAYLETLSVDVLKLDASFVARLDQPRNRAIVTSVLDLADALGFQVIAEGIETAEQATSLRDLGCRYGQGFHLARPSEAASVTDLLRAGALRT